MLGDLSFHSKALWGYDAEFMETIRPALLPAVDYLENWPAYVLEIEGLPVGFYGFRELDGRIFLQDLFVIPERVNQGLGKRLWAHLVETARAAGYPSFLIESDPNAEPFYLRMGARRIGEMRSGASGRTLPLLRYEFEPALS